MIIDISGVVRLDNASYEPFKTHGWRPSLSFRYEAATYGCCSRAFGSRMQLTAAVAVPSVRGLQLTAAVAVPSVRGL